MIFFSAICFPVLLSLLFGTNVFTLKVDSFFGPLNIAEIACIPLTIFTIPLGALTEFFLYNRHKIKKGNYSKLTFLKKQIEQERKEIKK